VIVASENVQCGHHVKADVFHGLNLQTSNLHERIRMDDKSSFYFKREEPNQSCLLAMREIVLKSDAEVEETVKYGLPCFCYRGKAFCYLWIDKKTTEPYFLIVEGKRINHPSLEAGDRKQMKILRVNPNEDLPIETIQSVLNEALDLYKNGTIKTK